MNNRNTVHCFFEQSGTFKKEFKKYFLKVYDYDILNHFNETDYVIDLFEEIRKAYNDEKSIFDDIKENDLIFAFFPCTRFEDQINLFYRGKAFQQKKWTDLQKLEYCKKIHSELSLNYEIITMLTIVCIRKKIKLIIENPKGGLHYLNRYWCLQSKVYISDRTKLGDIYKKPTQFWFINCNPFYNLYLDITPSAIKKTIIEEQNKVLRSMISPEFAANFIKIYVVDEYTCELC